MAEQTDDVQPSLSMLTAAHAASGVPMTCQLVLTNTGAITTEVGGKLDPDGARYTLLSHKYTLTGGAWTVISIDVETQNFTSQISDFILRGFTTDPTSGALLLEQDLTLMVMPLPLNSVYASVGGQGPVSAPLGHTVDYKTVTANLGATAITLTTSTVLLLSNGTRQRLSQGKAATVNPGQSVIVAGTVTPSQYSTRTGTYGVEVDVVDASGDLVSTDTFSFTQSALPRDYYSPSFTDTAVPAGVDISRSVVTIQGCGAGIAVADYDGDSLENIYVVDMGGTGHLWHTEGNGTFTDRPLPPIFRFYCGKAAPASPTSITMVIRIYCCSRQRGNSCSCIITGMELSPT